MEKISKNAPSAMARKQYTKYLVAESIKKEKESVLYDLFLTTREYRQDTLASVYFHSNKKIEKKSKPIDICGIRKKLNLDTGEITNYSRDEVQKNVFASVRRTKIFLNMLLEMNDFDWFATFTFDKQKIDRTDDRQCYEAYKKYVNNVKHRFESFRYVTVPERHEDNCIHFHMLVGGLSPRQLGLENSGKVCCSWAKYKGGICSKEFFDRTKLDHILTETDGLPVYNVTTFPYGFTTVTRIANRARCNSYVKKYVEKALGSTDIWKKRFFYSSNLQVPNIVKTTIGSDFTSPKKISELGLIINNPLFQNCSFSNYNEDYNTLQFWIDNEMKNKINGEIHE